MSGSGALPRGGAVSWRAAWRHPWPSSWRSLLASVLGHGAAQQPALREALAVAAVLVLVGGLGMRGAIVDAGMHRDLELEEPSAQALRLE